MVLWPEWNQQNFTTHKQNFSRPTRHEFELNLTSSYSLNLLNPKKRHLMWRWTRKATGESVSVRWFISFLPALFFHIPKLSNTLPRSRKSTSSEHAKSNKQKIFCVSELEQELFISSNYFPESAFGRRRGRVIWCAFELHFPRWDFHFFLNFFSFPHINSDFDKLLSLFFALLLKTFYVDFFSASYFILFFWRNSTSFFPSANGARIVLTSHRVDFQSFIFLYSG